VAVNASVLFHEPIGGGPVMVYIANPVEIRSPYLAIPVALLLM